MSRTYLQPRKAFTLIELLIVMGIIGILVGITLPAVRGFQQRAKVVMATNDMAQLSNAIGQFKTTFNGVKFVPNGMNFNGTSGQFTGYPQTITYLATVWNRLVVDPQTVPFFSVATQSGFNGGQPLDSNQSLVFTLGGPAFIPGGQAFGFGFAPSNSYPFVDTGAGSARSGPFFNFPIARLTNPNTNQFDGRFRDPWGNPYFFMTSGFNGNDYGFPAIPIQRLQPTPSQTAENQAGQSFVVWNDGQVRYMAPFLEVIQPLKYMESHGFQIVSAGPNGLTASPAGRFVAGEGAYIPDSPQGDDLANFHPGFLGATR